MRKGDLPGEDRSREWKSGCVGVFEDSRLPKLRIKTITGGNLLNIVLGIRGIRKDLEG